MQMPVAQVRLSQVLEPLERFLNHSIQKSFGSSSSSQFERGFSGCIIPLSQIWYGDQFLSVLTLWWLKASVNWQRAQFILGRKIGPHYVLLCA